MDNPWIVKKKEIVHETPWIKVASHDVIDPNGNPGAYSTVHFKKVAVGIIPLDEDYNTWIVGQYRFPTDAYSWEIVEGGAERAEDPLECAKRELSEEAGVAAEKWQHILSFEMSNAATDERAEIYIAKGLSFHNAHPDPDEQLQVKKLPFNELFEMVMKGELIDSMTVAGVLKAKLLMDQGLI